MKKKNKFNEFYPIYLASKNNNNEIQLKLLIDYFIIINYKYLIVQAIKRNEFDMVKLLIECACRNNINFDLNQKR